MQKMKKAVLKVNQQLNRLASILNA